MVSSRKQEPRRKSCGAVTFEYLLLAALLIFLALPALKYFRNMFRDPTLRLVCALNQGGGTMGFVPRDPPPPNSIPRNVHEALLAAKALRLCPGDAAPTGAQ